MAYFLRRIGFFFLTLWAALTLNFLIPRLQPGDPAEQIVQPAQRAGPAVDPAQVEAVRLMLGRRTRASSSSTSSTWGGRPGRLRHLLHLLPLHRDPHDRPNAALDRRPGRRHHHHRLRRRHPTGGLGGLLAQRPLRLRRHLGSTFLGTLPFFWIALVLLYFFAFKWGWFPPSGGYGGGVQPGWNGRSSPPPSTPCCRPSPC